MKISNCKSILSYCARFLSDLLLIKIRYFIFILIVLYLYLNLFKNALIDDSFISMCYVKTLLKSGTWGFYPGYTANTATSPLNIIFLALISLFFGVSANSAIIAALIGFAVIIVMLFHISQNLFNTIKFGYIAALAFISNPLMISCIGLEGILFAALFTVSIFCCLAKKWSALAITLGLLTITRAEGILFFIILILFIPSIKLKLKFAVIYLLSIAPWYLFSWIYLGSFIPDTFFIKRYQCSWDNWNFMNGAYLYLKKYPLETSLSFLFLPLILFFISKQIRSSFIVLLIMLLALIHFTAYSFLKVPPYHWYYVTEITAFILIGTLTMGFLYQNSGEKSKMRKTMRLIIALYLIIPAAGMVYILARDNFRITEMPVHTNWASHEQYKEIGTQLKKRYKGNVVLTNTEIGTLAYYSECYLQDCFSDRCWVRDYAIKHNYGNGFIPAIIRTNFYFYKDTRDYPECNYCLSGFTDRNNKGNKLLKWNISTKWIPKGLITLKGGNPEKPVESQEMRIMDTAGKARNHIIAKTNYNKHH